MALKSDTTSGFNKLFNDIKGYVKLQTDLLQIQAIEKLTRLLAKLFVIFLGMVAVIGLLFYLLMAVAHALAPLLGFVASYAIVGGCYILILLIFLIFKKQLIINPILRMMVDIFDDVPQKIKENTQDDE